MASPTKIVREVGRPTLVEEEIARFCVGISTSIIEQQQSLRLVASGSSMQSHVVTIKKNKVQLAAASYYAFLTQSITGEKAGRAPSRRFPPPDEIEDWIREKGIRGRGVTLNQLVFLISRGIAKRGTKIWQGKKQGISLAKAFNDADFNKTLEKIGLDLGTELGEAVIKTFGKKKKE